jgi:hypothetical protein
MKIVRKGALSNNLPSRFNSSMAMQYWEVLSVLCRCNRKVRITHSPTSYIEVLLARYVSVKL